MERRDGIFRPERNAYSASGRLTEPVLAIRSFHICLLRKTFARPCKPLEQGLHYGGRSRRVGTNVTIGRTGATARSGGRNTTSCRKASQTGRCWVDPCWGTMQRPICISVVNLFPSGETSPHLQGVRFKSIAIGSPGVPNGQFIEYEADKSSPTSWLLVM
jgi:hypothetical protein